MPGRTGEGAARRFLAAARSPERVAALVYIALFLLWYPPTFSIIDESTYLTTAYVYRAGTIHNDVAGIDGISRVRAGDHEVSKFAPLWPAMLAPFTVPGWRWAFVANLVLHLAGFALFARLVRRAGLPAWTSLLYLGHPTLLVYSRTLMSDTAAGVLFLAAWTSWRAGTRTSSIRAGVWAGLSCAVRYPNAVAVLLFVAAAAWDELRRRPSRGPATGPMIAGLAPVVAALALYNRIAFDTWWRGAAGYLDVRAGTDILSQFGWQSLPETLLVYLPALLLVYPLMLVAVFRYRGPDRRVLRIVALGFTGFFCLYYYVDREGGLLQSAVVSLRFLIPVLPLYLLAYAEVLSRRLAERRASPRVAAVAAALLLAGAVGLHARHDARLRAWDADRRLLESVTSDGSVILCDTAARKLVHHAWAERRPVRVEFGGRWEIPPRASLPGEVFVAMAGRGARNPMPAELGEWLGANGAEPIGPPDARLRIWRTPPPAGDRRGSAGGRPRSAAPPRGGTAVSCSRASRRTRGARGRDAPRPKAQGNRWPA